MLPCIRTFKIRAAGHRLQHRKVGIPPPNAQCVCRGLCCRGRGSDVQVFSIGRRNSNLTILRPVYLIGHTSQMGFARRARLGSYGCAYQPSQARRKQLCPEGPATTVAAPSMFSTVPRTEQFSAGKLSPDIRPKWRLHDPP